VTKTDDVIWKQIPEFPDYEVSSDGRVRVIVHPGWKGCIFHHGRTRILAQVTGGRANNYKRVMLHKPRKRHAYVHHLMAEAFLGPRLPGLIVLHTNDNGFDNRLCNIRYGDRDENELDRHVARVSPHLQPAPF